MENLGRVKTCDKKLWMNTLVVLLKSFYLHECRSQKKISSLFFCLLSLSSAVTDCCFSDQMQQRLPKSMEKRSSQICLSHGVSKISSSSWKSRHQTKSSGVKCVYRSLNTSTKSTHRFVHSFPAWSVKPPVGLLSCYIPLTMHWRAIENQIFNQNYILP